MADPTTVKRALHALAYGESVDYADEGATDVDARKTITAAAESLAAVDDAATVSERYGLDRLRSAIRAATARGDHDLAARGRETIKALTAYRRAAAGDGATPPNPDDDYFHSGRGTSLPGAGQRGDR